jgi:anti-sigma regulatory factor (Ser/Thr protein kinase)
VEATLRLPRSTDAPRLARKCVQRESEQLGRSERELVEVLMTELVTNAVTHPPAEVGGSVSVHFTVTSDRVRVAVRDSGEGFRDADLDRPRSEPGGYGLIMVDRGSSRWGTTHDDGNCVWFELDRIGTA